ncbi:predicted protein [Lichtheimia corymbifera JMRC:FSU:9682]|uniref:DUF7886 domain-containing protein n=1 Tax=Lichtheimia corymbifera JMRC:FSU:9682 TaxID=1263082 RepID=A0A068SBQ4_9FUNG|nr:predicted protein [Lichtheimia corymbifera JMRC:FSU:9682]
MLGPDPRRDLRRDTARLSHYLQECRSFASLRGFKHFNVFMRGREEFLLCTPASKDTLFDPRDDQLKKRHPTCTVLLFTGYARYKCPYVYFRSYPDQDNMTQSDDPLTLKTTDDWRRQDVALWKMVFEVLTLVMKKPSPRNPFQVDFQYIDSRPPEEGALLSASLLNFLETIWLQADPNLEQDLIDQVYEDIKALQLRHVDHVYEHITSAGKTDQKRE